jgi:3-oxoacyl-[acyl-carrier protein] reductase
MFDLSGRRALVTGASGGLGQAIVRALHAHGTAVTLTGTRRDPLDALAGALGSRAHVVVGDLGEPGGADRIAATAAEAMGAVDILVNNAGIARYDPAATLSDGDWARVLDIDLSATFRLARAVVGGMAARGWGRIIGIGSLIGAIGDAGLGHYAAAKAGMIGLSKALALEYAGRGVTVNVVAPGYIRTPMTDMNSPERLRAILARIPVGHLGAPDDVAAAVVYLAGDHAGFVTGATLHVNGGQAMI